MKIPIYQVDAFTGRVFAGNPAAVCPLQSFLDDETLQSIAAENNLSETAFFTGRGGSYDIRWMTPKQEVDLCGHATLASAHVIFRFLEPTLEAVSFRSRSGVLRVARNGDLLSLDFPARPPAPCEVPGLPEALGRRPESVLRARDIVAVFKTQEEVLQLRPDMGRVAALDAFAVCATAPGTDADFVSRFFAPGQGIPEDPATGSSHSSLVPYWSKRLGRNTLHARQLSERGGEFFCEDRGERVSIAGRAAVYLTGTIEI
jgi:PhzF family phenazine biosynthesis protein